MSGALSHDHAAHASHGSLKSYIVGFALSLVLTFASFGVVMTGKVPHDLMMPGLVLFGVIQLVVQLIFFLHLNGSKEGRGNLVIMLFTVLILSIVVGGCLWVLHNMNVNMMHPTSQMMPME